MLSPNGEYFRGFMIHRSRDGFFDVVELWVENRVLLELLPPNIVPKYLAFMQPQALQKFLENAAVGVAKALLQTQSNMPVA